MRGGVYDAQARPDAVSGLRAIGGFGAVMDIETDAAGIVVLAPDDDADKKTKASKSEVDYDRGEKSAHCGVCRHYTWARADVPIQDGECALVTGYIEPSYWCKKFARSGSKKE